MWQAAAAGAGIGAIVGAQKNRRYSSPLERMAADMSQNSLQQLQQYVDAGANQQDVQAGTQAQRDFGALLAQYQGSGMYDLGTGKTMAAQMFEPQRALLQNAFQQQLQQANRAAQLAGRSGNDPILRARLAQAQAQQELELGAQQQQAAFQFGREAVTDKLSLGGQRASILGNLGQQAISNRQMLQQTAYNTLQGERNFSLQLPSEGGGWMGALTGALQGAQAGMSFGQGMSAMNANNAAAAYYTQQGQQAPQSNPFAGFQPSFQATPSTVGYMGTGDSYGGAARPMTGQAPAAPLQPSGQFALASSRNAVAPQVYPTGYGVGVPLNYSGMPMATPGQQRMYGRP